MPALSDDLRLRHPAPPAEPPLRRQAAKDRFQPAPESFQYRPRAHWKADPGLSRSSAQQPLRQSSQPRAHAFLPPTDPGNTAPEPLLDALAASSSANYSWPEDPAAQPVHTTAPSSAHPARPALARRSRRDPSPSRLSYRLHRLWLTPFIRRGITVGLPVFIVVLALGLWLGDDARRAQAQGFFTDLRTAFENRPEFQVNSLSVHAETPEVAQAITRRLGLEFPVSSFRLDLQELRHETEALDAVEVAALRIRSGGVLEVSVIEREPAMVWRHHGGLELVDIEGRRIARLAEREARADLPLIAGEGAPAAISEARQLLAAASPLRDRLRGLVRVGERRWDVVLDRGQRIMLPAEGALPALERVLALDGAQGLLARDVSVVDLRDASRPTIRLSQPAMAELHRIRNQVSGVPNR